ncbi:MAG TPA: Clp protease N-terminal domain-containing protein [Trebonia sp.]|jgi:ATP-dependent Clp protease ATP-binding subunit ClpA
MPRISPNPACYRVLGRADEIAHVANSPHMRAEHLFLAIIHDNGMPAQVLARLADISRLEAAVTEAAGRPAAQPDERPSRPELAGFRVAAEMGDSYVGTWHLLLALIRDRESVPARALAGLVDLGQVETAVTDVMNSPGFHGFKDSFDEDELLLPEGLKLDQALIGALARSIPEGAAFGFNWRQDDGRPWIHVSRPGDPRAALNTALVSLGRLPLT